MERLQKSMLKISQSYLNLRQFTLTLLLCITIFTSCTTTGSDEGTVVPPPVPSPLELGDISLVPSSGGSSSYAAATVAIEGAVIVISDIPNLADTTTQTLTLNIADKEDPVTYTVEPASVTIPAAVLNPEGTDAVRTRLENVEFVLTPTAAGGEPITYGVEVRLDEFIALTPLVVEDITIAAGSHPAYADATIASVNDNIITISGIKNKEDGFSEDLMLMIKDATDPAEYEVSGGDTVTLPGAELNPDGVASISTVNNEVLTVTVTPTAPGSVPVKYYVHLRLGDLIQLKLLGGELGIFSGLLELSERSSPSATKDAMIGECNVFSSSPPFEVFSGGSLVPSTISYALTVTGGSSINSYVTGQTHSGVSLTLTEGSTEINTFPSLNVITSACTSAALSGDGMSSDTAYIIDNDRKLELIARLVNADTDGYKSAHYRVTERIDLGVAEAPWWRADLTMSDATTPNGAGFTPIGMSDSTNFAGTFDCDNNEIANLYISNTTGDYVGLFGYTSGATIQSCHLRVVKVTGNRRVGGLVGEGIRSTISRSYVTGAVSGATNVGGLVGVNAEYSTITNSYVVASVTGIGTANINIGGLAGSNRSRATISSSYATGTVMGNSRVGGLVGQNGSDDKTIATITDSYAVGNVTGTSEVGGLVGFNFFSSITYSYAIGRVTGSADTGGLVGEYFPGIITASYYTDSAAGGSGTSRSTTDLQSTNAATDFPGWNNDGTIWEFAPNNQYPRLKNVVCANRQYNQAATECTGL